MIEHGDKELTVFTPGGIIAYTTDSTDKYKTICDTIIVDMDCGVATPVILLGNKKIVYCNMPFAYTEVLDDSK
jgi:hypothetical protein